MSEATLNYWVECLSQSLEEHGVTATPEQVAAIAKDVEICHENYGMAFYTPYEHPDTQRAKDAEAALLKEQRKVPCETCKGAGRIISYGPHHGSDTQCWKCRGEGKVSP